MKKQSKIVGNVLSQNVSLCRSASEVNEVFSGPRPVLHPSFVEIRPAVFVQSCWQTNQATKQPASRWHQTSAGDIRPQQSPDWQHLNASPVECRAASQLSPETRFRTQNLDPAVHSRLYRIRTCLWGGDGGQTDCFKSESNCVSALTLMKTRSALIKDQYQQLILQLIFIYLWISVWLNTGLWLAAGCLLISSSSSRYHRVEL